MPMHSECIQNFFTLLVCVVPDASTQVDGPRYALREKECVHAYGYVYKITITHVTIMVWEKFAQTYDCLYKKEIQRVGLATSKPRKTPRHVEN